jgi:hypothetical protein
MNSHRLVLMGLALLSSLSLIGCSSTDYGNTSPYHPGPVVGKTIGNAAGVVAGNSVGLGVGIVEGTVAGAAAPFNPNYRMVRTWKAETTTDGRTIQVPYDTLVDQYGRPVNMPAPTGNSSPPTLDSNTPAR